MASRSRHASARVLASAIILASAIAASEPEKITRIVDYEVSIAPDNQRLAFISNRDGRFKLYVSRLDGSQPRRVTDGPGIDDNPSWSPDGKSIAIASEQDGDSDIWIVPLDGRAARRVTTAAGADIHPAWSPDGRRLLFTTLRNSPAPDKPQLDIDVVGVDGVDGRGEARVTSGPVTSFASWSPDGTLMTYWRMFGDNADIVLADAAGRQVKRLTVDPAFDGWPSWSPDGREIAFARERGDDADIYAVDLAGKQRLVAGGAGRKTGPRWSADGRFIYYSRQFEREIRLWRVAAR